MTENSEVLDTTQELSPTNLEKKRELVKLLLAKQRAVADKKLINFVPTLIQRLVLLAKEKIVLVLGANRCIGGMEEIYDPILKKKRRVDSIGEDFHVYAWDGTKPVIAKAKKPFTKGTGVLNKYRVVSRTYEEVFYAFGTHRVLSPGGYLPIGDKVSEASPFLRLTTLGNDPIVRNEDVQSWLKKVRDFLASCSVYFRLYDEQLRWVLDICPSVVQLQVYVPKHISCVASVRMDGSDNRPNDSRLDLSRFLLSIRDDLDLTVAQFFDILYHVFCILSVSNVYQSEASELLFLASNLFQSIPESVQRDIRSIESGPCVSESCKSPNLEVVNLHSIEQIGVEVKWDFEVEGYSNYIHKGLIHHNSGKSEVIAVDSQVRGTGLIPEVIRNEYPQEFVRMGEAWLCGLDFVSLMGIVKKKVDKFLPNRLNGGYNKENKIQKYTNGFEIQYRSCDQGREKFQGTSKNYVSFDEEPPQDVYDEGYMRTVDCSGVIRLAFTPLKGLSWAYKNLYKRAHRIIYTENIHGIKEAIGIIHTPEEIKKLKDRRIVTITNTGADIDQDIVVFQMAIYDNPYLPESEIWKAEKKYAEDPASYNARILGRFTTITGRNVFDTDSLLRRQPSCPKPQAVGDVVNGQFQKSIKGRLQIFKDLKEIHDDQYVIGADVAEGLEEGDFSCAQVLSKKTGEQVAIWHGKVSPDEFASILNSVGRFFRNADLAPERNFHGFAVVNRLREHFKYPNLFSEYDATNLDKVSAGKTLVKRYGWDTNAKTKPLMIQELGAFLRANHIIINDTATIDELITYVYDKDGKTEAMGGCYDDRVMSLAIALQVFLKRRIIRQPTFTKQQTPRNPTTGY